MIINESNSNTKPYKLSKYNSAITKVTFNPKDHAVSANIASALDYYEKKKVIDGHLSSPGSYEVYHYGKLSIDQLDKLISDYTGY